MKNHKILSIFILLIIVISLVLAYSHFIATQMITLHEYKITNENIPENYDGLKIIQISDIHYGRMFDKNKLNRLIKSINEQEPDIVVLTGDLIDKDTNLTTTMANELGEGLKKIQANVAKYAITGNHDYKFDEWQNIIETGNFENLNNTYDTIYKNGYSSILIAGVSTVVDKQNINDKLTSTIDYINSFENGGPVYKILLIHEPDVIDKLNNNKFDLILAGHTHGGQVRLPFLPPIILPTNGQKYPGPYYKIGNADMYVSNGLGVSTIDFRLFDTPSYNIYRLTNK